MNAEMMQRYAPELAKSGTVPIGNPNDTGGGIQMGLSVGARAINMHEGFLSVPFYPPATLTHGIFVNGQGQRFINEDAYHGRIGCYLVKQTFPVYLVLNVDDYADYETASWLAAPVRGTGETLEELAAELDLPHGVLAETVGQYNVAAERGMDAAFHKSKAWLKPLTGPYVALDCTPGAGAFLPHFTLGGLDTTVDGAVLNSEGECIGGTVMRQDGLRAAFRGVVTVTRLAARWVMLLFLGDEPAGTLPLIDEGDGMTDESVIARLDRLESLDDIRQLAAKYSLALDMRDLDAMVNLFPADVRVGKDKVGRAYFKQWMDETLREQFTGTAHHIGNHIIEFEDPDRAVGVVYSKNEHETPTADGGSEWVIMQMLYWDHYQRIDGRLVF